MHDFIFILHGLRNLSGTLVAAVPAAETCTCYWADAGDRLRGATTETGGT
jgi:hypothetical protein